MSYTRSMIVVATILTKGASVCLDATYGLAISPARSGSRVLHATPITCAENNLEIGSVTPVGFNKMDHLHARSQNSNINISEANISHWTLIDFSSSHKPLHCIPCTKYQIAMVLMANPRRSGNLFFLSICFVCMYVKKVILGNSITHTVMEVSCLKNLMLLD